jgi:hypothetical protein
VVCPVLKNKLQLNLISEKEQAKKKGSFNLPLNICMKTQEGFLGLIFLLNI